MDKMVIKKECLETLIFIFILTTCIKVMLMPTYHSTDFEVHRNWLAITYSLPINEWYINNESPWTLDYPPFFAWFEYFLSQFAAFFDIEMLKVDNFNYASFNTVLFQRGSVITIDCIFAYSVYKISKLLCDNYNTYNNKYETFVILSLTNLGLLIVDHIHFQYNGFLIGILLLSISYICSTDKSKSSNEKHVLLGSLLFAILLNLKHIYLYIAPVYVVWLLKWCWQNNFIKRFLKLGSVVTFIFILSFGPFVKQLPQVLSRLFPFKRGLVHAYWAPNVWAVYVGVDKILAFTLKYIGLLKNVKTGTMTGGLVQEESCLILPTPTPLVTFVLTFMSMLPMLIILFKRDFTSKNFLKCIVISGFCSFMFGWHVHEKAILTVIFPLCILAMESQKLGREFVIISAAGHTALLPLIHPPELTSIKIVFSITWLILLIYLLSRIYKSSSFLKVPELCYIIVLPLITIYDTVLHKVIFHDKLPFLPLMLTSLYCAIGLIYSFLNCYYDFIQQEDELIEKSYKKHLVDEENKELKKVNKKVKEKSQRLNNKKQN